MALLGFVPPVVAAPVLAPVINFVGLAVATVGAAVGINKVIDAVTPKPPQSPVDDPVSFEPWGDDPYEEPLEADPEPSYSPLAETPAPVPSPPPTPAPVPPKPTNVNETTDPQAPLTDQFVPTPKPQPPGTSGRLGGYYWKLLTFNGSGNTSKVRLQFKNTYSPWIQTRWDILSYEVTESLIEGSLIYKPRIRLLDKSTTTYLWEPEIELISLPSLSAYTATIDLYESGTGKWAQYSVARFASLTETNYLKRTYVIRTTPAYLPQEEEKKSPLPTEPIPELEPETEIETAPSVQPLPPIPLAPPLAPPDSVPLPIEPGQLPILDETGRPVRPRRPVYTLPGTHVIETPGGTIQAPGGTARPTLTSIAKEVARIESKSAQMLKNTNGTGDLINKLPALLAVLDLIASIFEQPLPAAEYSISGVCEEPGEDGRQPSTTIFLPPEKWADRLISQSEVVPELLQAHLGYKTPTCSSPKPPLEGDWITTRWISDEKMAHSDRRLRKLFRYRSKSSRDLVQLSGYWESFSWRAGPVCVIHKGAWWGTPQVWAESAEEGKRVIRHAATEAGIDPDQVGRWEIGGSRSPRYGMSGTMRIHLHKGFPWVASRDGAAWPNYLAKQV